MKTTPTIIAASIFTCMPYNFYASPHEVMDIEKETESHRGGIMAKEARPGFIETWLANIQGKTLSTIGNIVTIRIRREEEIHSKAHHSIALTHQEVLRIIEHYEIGDFSSISVALGSPPQFSVEYADGMSVLSYGNYAVITLPQGRTGNVVLLQKKGSPSASRTSQPLAAILFR